MCNLTKNNKKQTLYFLFVLMQTDKRKLQEMSCEVQRKEEWLQEERMDREKLEAELGSERDCSRVRKSKNIRIIQYTNTFSRKYNYMVSSSC